MLELKRVCSNWGLSFFPLFLGIQTEVVGELDQLLEQQTQMDIRMSAFQHMLYASVLYIHIKYSHIKFTRALAQSRTVTDMIDSNDNNRVGIASSTV